MKISPAACGGAPITLIYGAEGRGKTTLAAKFPKPVAMLLERGPARRQRRRDRRPQVI